VSSAPRPKLGVKFPSPGVLPAARAPCQHFVSPFRTLILDKCCTQRASSAGRPWRGLAWRFTARHVAAEPRGCETAQPCVGAVCRAKACSCAQPRSRPESGPETGRRTQAQPAWRLAIRLVSRCRASAQARTVCCTQPKPVQLRRACVETRCSLSTSGDATPRLRSGCCTVRIEDSNSRAGLAHSLDSAGSSVASGPAEATNASYSRGAETYSTSAPNEEGCTEDNTCSDVSGCARSQSHARHHLRNSQHRTVDKSMPT
jgi:hypothetical protein